MEQMVIITDKPTLKSLLRELMMDMGGKDDAIHSTHFPIAIPAPVSDEELNTRRAKKWLKERGYSVQGWVAFSGLMKLYGIVPEKRSKENWYKLHDLEKIPRRN